MKKFFEIIGLISLTIFSFFITDKTVTVVNNMDNMMIEIKANKNKLLSEPIDATINDNDIIPGISGKKININKSYKNMKKKGYYSDELYIYDTIPPKVSIKENMNKYIIKANPNKKSISLIFKIKANDNIDEIINIIENFNIKASFFIEENWFNNNTKYIKKLIEKGNTVAPLFKDYTDSNFEWIDLVIKNSSKKNYGFCYSSEYNNQNIDSCKIKNNYTIKPIEISDKSPLTDIKNQLEAGALFSVNISSQLKKELSTIIIFIKSKGLSITNLDESIIE